MARLSDSVAPEVHTISLGSQLMRSAICCQQFQPLLLPPNQICASDWQDCQICLLKRHSLIFCATLGSTGVVAANQINRCPHLFPVTYASAVLGMRTSSSVMLACSAAILSPSFHNTGKVNTCQKVMDLITQFRPQLMRQTHLTMMTVSATGAPGASTFSSTESTISATNISLGSRRRV